MEQCKTHHTRIYKFGLTEMQGRCGLHCKQRMEAKEQWLNKSMFSPGWVLTVSVSKAHNDNMKATTKEMLKDKQNIAHQDRARSAILDSIGSQERPVRQRSMSIGRLDN